MRLSFADTQVILLNFMNFIELLFKIQRCMLQPPEARPEVQEGVHLTLLEWASLDPLLGATVLVLCLLPDVLF